MEPIEINAGAWYLRALRCDERVDDRPALAEGGVIDPDYIDTRTRQWLADVHYSWAVCEPTTGEMLAEAGLTLSGGSATVTGWARAGHEAALAAGQTSVRRFGESGLGLEVSESR